METWDLGSNFLYSLGNLKTWSFLVHVDCLNTIWLSADLNIFWVEHAQLKGMQKSVITYIKFYWTFWNTCRSWYFLRKCTVSFSYWLLSLLAWLHVNHTFVYKGLGFPVLFETQWEQECFIKVVRTMDSTLLFTCLNISRSPFLAWSVKLALIFWFLALGEDTRTEIQAQITENKTWCEQDNVLFHCILWWCIKVWDPFSYYSLMLSDLPADSSKMVKCSILSMCLKPMLKQSTKYK